jgi:hypothetical protein
MTIDAKHYTGGCLCGALRYEAVGESIGSGHCYCADCRRASGSGFIPFMGFPAEAVRFTGEAREFRSKAANGGDAVRNRCAQCMSSCSAANSANPTRTHSTPARSTTPPPSIRRSPSSPRAARPGRSSRPASRSLTECRPSAKSQSVGPFSNLKRILGLLRKPRMRPSGA